MLTSLLLSAVVFLPQGAETPAGDAAKVLREALKAKDVGQAIEKLEEFGLSSDKAVIQAVGEGLKHSQESVRLVALQALRYNKDKAALSELLKAGKSSKILKDEELAEQYYLALGQHADKKAFSILTQGLNFGKRGNKVTQARVLSIGRIRTRESVEFLMKLVVSSRRNSGYSNQLRMSLTALTGHDAGNNDRAWVAWWNDNKNSLKIQATEPELPGKAGNAWKKIWTPPGEGREGKKGEKEKGKRGGKNKRRQDPGKDPK